MALMVTEQAGWTGPEITTWQDLRWLWCPDCVGQRGFERPPSPDVPTDGCLEWVCTGCGAAHLW